MWTRVVLAVLVLPLGYLLAQPHAPSTDDHYTFSQGGLGARVRNLYRQQDAIAQGHYLADEDGDSFTRDAIERVGQNLLFADLALYRTWRDQPPPTVHDVFRVQAPVFVAALLILLVSGAPLWTVALALALFVLFPAPVSTLPGQRAWPQLIALSLAVGALTRIAHLSTQKENGRGSLIALGAMGFGIGLLGSLRDEASVIAAAPFLALMLMSIGAASLRLFDGGSEVARRRMQALVARVRDSIRTHRRLPSFPHARPDLRVAALCALVLLGVQSAAWVEQLHLRLFESIEDVEHRPEVGQHLFWHPLFLGLGFYDHEQENLEFRDEVGTIDVHAQSADFDGRNPAGYERGARARYLEIVWHNTPYVVYGYLGKLRHLAFDANRPVSLALGLAVVILFTLAGRRVVVERSFSALCLVVSGTSIVLLAAAPPLMTGTRYASAYNAALVVMGALCLSVLLSRERDARDPDSDGGDRDPALAAASGSVLRAVAVVILVVAALVSMRAAWIEQSRAELSAALIRGDRTLESLFTAYHADAVVAFNALSHARRIELVDEFLATRPDRLSPGVKVTGGGENSAIAAAVRTDRALFVVTDTEPGVTTRKLRVALFFSAPMIKPYANLELHQFLPPHKGTEESHWASSQIHIPSPLPAAPWLFSLRVTPDAVPNLTINERGLHPTRKQAQPPAKPPSPTPH